MVKGPTSLPAVQQLGRTVEVDGRHHVVALFDDTRQAPAAATNTYFARWHTSLAHWETRGPIACKRLAHGMDTAQLFDFLLQDGIGVELHGPFTTTVTDPVAGGPVESLPFSAQAAYVGRHPSRTGLHRHLHSVAHTINGHSVAMRLTFGNVRINLTGDLNRDSMDAMLAHLTPAELACEIAKAPHHGSADFDFEALQHMKPVVTIVSSGDESAAKEYIHPRATLMAALGNVSQAGTSLLFTTELAAFFAMRQESYTVEDLKDFFNARATDSFTGSQVAKLLGKDVADGGPPGMLLRVRAQQLRHRAHPHRRPARAGVHAQRQGSHQRGLSLYGVGHARGDVRGRRRHALTIAQRAARRSPGWSQCVPATASSLIAS